MSDAALQLPSASSQPQPAAPAAWIELAEAASRSGLSAGHLRRRCLESWEAAGQARRDRGNSGQSTWFIREDADPAFARPITCVEEVSRQISVEELKSLGDAHCQELLRKQQILQEWEKAIAGGAQMGMDRNEATRRFLDRLQAETGQTVSRSSLYGWHAAYRREGIKGLIDERKLPSSASGNLIEDPFFAYFASVFLTPRQLSVKICHAMAEQKAIESGWAVRSYKAAQRFVASLDPALVTKKREGEKAFVDKHEPNLRRDYSSIDSNSWWVSDHHRFDVMILHPDSTPEKPQYCRPWVTAWMDARSRKVLGWRVFVHDPNTDTILAAFVMAAEANGLPEIAYQDNGKDYDAKAIQGVTKRQRRAAGSNWQQTIDRARIDGAFGILQIKVVHAWPYHGQSKGIERTFRTVCDQFSRLQDAYCGNATTSAVRDVTEPRNLQSQLASGKALTLKEFSDAFASFLENIYHRSAHRGDGMNGQSPAVVYETCLTSRRTTTAEILYFACMPRVGPVKVGQDGVVYRGLWYGGFDVAVHRLYGRQVLLAVNNENLARVLILDTEGRLICTAAANRKLAFDPNSQDLRDAIADKRQLRRRLREYDQARPRMAMVGDTQALLERAAARRALAEAQQSGEPLPPTTIQAIATGLEDQQQSIRSALDALSRQPLRKAVNDDLSHDEQLPDIGSAISHLRLVGDDEPRPVDVFGSLEKASQDTREELP